MLQTRIGLCSASPVAEQCMLSFVFKLTEVDGYRRRIMHMEKYGKYALGEDWMLVYNTLKDCLVVLLMRF